MVRIKKNLKQYNKYVILLETMFLNIGKAKVSSTKCCWSNCNASHPDRKLHCIPWKTRYDIIKMNRFFIPKRSLACDLHCHYSVRSGIRVPHEKCSFEADKIEEMVDLLCSEPLKDTVQGEQFIYLIFSPDFFSNF